MHLCCKFPVCRSQPFKEGDAGGRGRGVGAEDGGSRQRGPVRGPQTLLCKSCFHPPWMMAGLPARGDCAGMEGLDPRLPDSRDTPGPPPPPPLCACFYGVKLGRCHRSAPECHVKGFRVSLVGWAQAKSRDLSEPQIPLL